MYHDVIKARDQAKSFSDFQFRLIDMGISFIIMKSSLDNSVLGVTFSRSGYSIKGFKLDRNLGIFKILKHFNLTTKSERQGAGKRYVQVPMVEQESRVKSQDESKVKELAAGLFEGNLGKSHEQDMKVPPRKKKGLRP